MAGYGTPTRSQLLDGANENARVSIFWHDNSKAYEGRLVEAYEEVGGTEGSTRCRYRVAYDYGRTHWHSTDEVCFGFKLLGDGDDEGTAKCTKVAKHDGPTPKLLVGSRVDVPATEFGLKGGGIYSGKIVKVRGNHAQLLFDDDGQKLWYNVHQVHLWIDASAAENSYLVNYGPSGYVGSSHSPSNPPSAATVSGGSVGCGVIGHMGAGGCGGARAQRCAQSACAREGREPRRAVAPVPEEDDESSDVIISI